MRVSERMREVKSSAAWALLALVNERNTKGAGILNFGTGEPDFETPAHIRQAAIRAIEDGKTKYTPVGGIPALKNAVISKFRDDNHLQYEPGQVTVNCGGKHSLYNLMQVLLDQGDEVIIPAPYWETYPPVVLLAGGTPVIAETRAENGYKLTAGELRKRITARTRALLVNSPSNPAGAVYSTEDLEALAAVISKRDIAVISDDIYEYILYDNASFSNIANTSERMKKKTIVLNGVSKAYSMTGWRIGYMAGDAGIIKNVEILQSQSTSNPASISQYAAVEALNGGRSAVKAMSDAYARRRALMVEGLNGAPGLSCSWPRGAFYAFPDIAGVTRLPGWKTVKRKYAGSSVSTALSSYLLDEGKVATVPGIEFGSDSNIRLSFAASDESISRGVERIREALGRLA